MGRSLQDQASAFRSRYGRHTALWPPIAASALTRDQRERITATIASGAWCAPQEARLREDVLTVLA